MRLVLPLHLNCHQLQAVALYFNLLMQQVVLMMALCRSEICQSDPESLKPDPGYLLDSFFGSCSIILKNLHYRFNHQFRGQIVLPGH
jgi:hypothetical protein